MHESSTTENLARLRKWGVRACIGSLMAVQILGGLFAFIASSDTNRDIFFAQQIASGQSFPLSGPDINAMLHLGPLWFYLLAPALLIWNNAASVTTLMALLSSLQFPLAFHLGRRFDGNFTGVLFALGLAIPSWAIVSFAAMTHTIVVVPALLLGALSVARYRSVPTLSRAAVVAIASALMIMAHPTLVDLVALMWLWAGLGTQGFVKRAAPAVFGFFAIAVSLLSMVYEQWHLGFGDATTTSQYTKSDWSLPSVVQVVRLIYSVLVYGPAYVAHFWLRLGEWPERVFVGVCVLPFLAAVAGIIIRVRQERQIRPLAIGLIAVLIIHAAFLCCIRAVMPPWMVYALCPILVALMALGLGAFARYSAWRAPVVVVVSIAACLTICLHDYLAQGSPEHVEIRPSPGKHALYDVREYEESELTYRLPRARFMYDFSLSDKLCQRVTLYGHYAYLVDYTYAVGAAAGCGSTANIEFGGSAQAGRAGWLGLDDGAWTALDAKPDFRVASLGVVAPKAIWHSGEPLVPVVPHLTNWPRQLKKESTTFSVEGDAAQSDVVVASYRAHRYSGFEIVSAEADGVSVQPTYQDAILSVFRWPHPGSGIHHWKLTFSAVDEYVDVLTFEARPLR